VAKQDEEGSTVCVFSVCVCLADKYLNASFAHKTKAYFVKQDRWTTLLCFFDLSFIDSFRCRKKKQLV